MGACLSGGVPSCSACRRPSGPRSSYLLWRARSSFLPHIGGGDAGLRGGRGSRAIWVAADGIGYPREVVEGTYAIRTFGCRMNEHDSERIAGLLLADGMTPADRFADARVVVLNTCAIRENADNKLYGNLGHLKPLKAANPQMRIVVSGCLAQKDQGEIQRRAPWVDVVVGTHALPHLLDLLERSETEGPQMDVREQTETFPSALPAARDDAFRAGSRSRRGATTPARSASCRSCRGRSVPAPSATSWPRSRGSPPGSSR